MDSIGFFDSGVGGLTVLKVARELLPGENYLYFADSDHAPYGVRPAAEVRNLFLQAADFIVDQGVKALVVACNTATSVGIEAARERYRIPVIGMEPAVKPALSHAAGKRVLILATELTLKLEKLSSLVERLDTQNQVDCLPLQALVGMAERMELSAERVIPYLEDQFSSINWSSYGSVVLGCTHFPFFEAHLKRLLPPHISIFDGIRGTVAHLRNQLTPQPATDLPGRVAYYESGRLIPPEKMEAYFTYL